MADVFSTIVTSVLILVIGQIVVKSIIEPLQAFAKLKGEIAHFLTYDRNISSRIADVYLTDVDRLAASGKESDKVILDRQKEIIKAMWIRADEASNRLRNQASQLRAMQFTIPLYPLWAWLKIVPPVNNLAEASTGLIGMSNSVHDGTSHEHMKKVAKFLDMESFSFQ